MTLGANDWSRLTHEVYQRVYDKTGDDEFAQALAWGGAAAVAAGIAPWGMASKVIPAPYQMISEPFLRVMDSIVSDHLANKVADEGVDYIVDKNNKRDKKE